MNLLFKIHKSMLFALRLSVLMMIAGYAMAYPIDVKLLADAEWLPEGSGVLLSTDKGYVYIFNQHMDKLGDAKKGDCYSLEADTEDYVTIHKKKYPGSKAFSSQREISSWEKIKCKTGVAKAVRASSASINDLKKSTQWKAEIKGWEYQVDDFEQIRAETPRHFIVYQNAGVSCAAGGYWLFNKQSKSYRPIDPGACDDRNFKVILDSEKVIFMSGKK